MSGVKVLLLPPRPCTQTTAGPSPSSSTAILSMRWKAMRAGSCGSAEREAVLDRADAVDLDAIGVAVDEPLRRLEAHADAGRRAGRDHVARAERDAARARLDERRDVEDQVARGAALAQLGLAAAGHEPAAHARVARVELVGRHDPRAHRAEGVEALAEVPLLVAHLHVARAH